MSKENLNYQLTLDFKSEKSFKLAEIEIHYRANIKHNISKILCSNDSYNVLKKVYNDEILDFREEFRAIYLNRSNIINGICLHSTGTTTGALVDFKSIIGAAIISNSSGIILCHNHPSGAVIPSKEDKKLTQEIIKAADIFDIQILDHLIISRDQYYSFADDGRI